MWSKAIDEKQHERMSLGHCVRKRGGGESVGKVICWHVEEKKDVGIGKGKNKRDWEVG